MNIRKWLSDNTKTLEGKKIAISGATGGIGRRLCRYLLFLGSSIVLIDRNQKRSDHLREELIEEFADAEISQIILDLEDMESVENACKKLEIMHLYALILNAGAYSIPRHKCSTGYDNVFQINFLSPYYMARKLAGKTERIIAVGSIAHNYSKSDSSDVDFSGRKSAGLVYGNAKRYLMFSLMGYFENDKRTSLSVVHPGITFTGITNHYPPFVFTLIKHPMKIIFMKPEKACLSIVKGLFEATESGSWIGPRIFDIWGSPVKKKLNTASFDEQKYICETAEKIYNDWEKRSGRT